MHTTSAIVKLKPKKNFRPEWDSSLYHTFYRYVTHKVATSQLASVDSSVGSTALAVSQRSWVPIPFRPRTFFRL